MVMVKEGEYDDAVRRMGHKKLVERLEAARLETKWEKSTPRAAKQEEQELVEKKKEERKVYGLGKVEVKKWEEKRRSERMVKKKVELERMR